MRDPLHDAIMMAAKSVLASVAASSAPSHPHDTPARQLGRNFATLNSKQLVTLYVEVFIRSVVESLVSRADIDPSTGFAPTAIRLVEKSASRIGRRVLDRVEKAGAITTPI